jgi:hypothetical protein
VIEVPPGKKIWILVRMRTPWVSVGAAILASERYELLL